jgi:hypothetical protein
MTQNPQNLDNLTVSDSFSLSPLMVKKPSANRWVTVSWSLLGVLPGLSQQQISEAQLSGEVVELPAMTVQLFKQHCEAYYQNLLSSQPQLYLVTETEADALQPLLMTVDYDEAASYMETDHIIHQTALPDALCVWLERYVLKHYVPEQKKKRRRQQWFDPS